MRLLGRSKIDEFKRKHSSSRKSLDNWVKAIEGCKANNFVELKKTFNSADQVGSKTVFNAGGNKFRVIVITVYILGQATVTHVLTHEDYNKGKWK